MSKQIESWIIILAIAIIAIFILSMLFGIITKALILIILILLVIWLAKQIQNKNKGNSRRR